MPRQVPCPKAQRDTRKRAATRCGDAAPGDPLAKADWVTLFKKTFKFTGGEITEEFLMSTGYLPGAHVKSCTVFVEVKSRMPA